MVLKLLVVGDEPEAELAAQTHPAAMSWSPRRASFDRISAAQQDDLMPLSPTTAARTLRTSSKASPPMTPKVRKLISRVEARNIHSPDVHWRTREAGSVPTSPHSPGDENTHAADDLQATDEAIQRASICWRTSSAPASPWDPTKDEALPVPALLAFESWFTEGGKRIRVQLEYHTPSGQCRARIGTVVTAELTCKDGSPVSPWDLHVGAQLQLLGRQLTLKRVASEATCQWIDNQAKMLLEDKAVLRQELSKFRPVLDGPMRDAAGRRCERFDLRTRHAMPLGGRANLRNLRSDVEDLAAALRQHRPYLPPIRSHAPVGITGPEDWCPDRQANEQLKRLQSLHHRRVHTPKQDWRQHDFIRWLQEIPLAESAARSKTQPEMETPRKEPAKRQDTSSRKGQISSSQLSIATFNPPGGLVGADSSLSSSRGTNGQPRS